MWLLALHCTHLPLCRFPLPSPKGLLLSAIRDPNPVVVFEAKMLYRTAVEDVPTGDYSIPLGRARIARAGSDVTLVGWGQQVLVLEQAVSAGVGVGWVGWRM